MENQILHDNEKPVAFDEVVIVTDEQEEPDLEDLLAPKNF